MPPLPHTGVRQRTDHDPLCKVRAFGDSDVFMKCLMKEMLGGVQEAEAWERSLQAKVDFYNRKRPPSAKTRGDVFVKKRT